MPDDRPYLRPYLDAERRFGPSFEATLWASREKQIVRFAVLAEMVDLEGRTILDAGSGMGDFAYCLDEWGINYKKYVGLEAIDSVVMKGKERGLRNATFLTSDFAAEPDALRKAASEAGLTEPPDVVVFCGSLNTFKMKQALVLLERGWELAGQALVFNFLSARHKAGGGRPSAGSGPALRFDPLPVLEWAMTRTPSVRFRQDYFAGHDATVAMYKDARSGV